MCNVVSYFEEEHKLQVFEVKMLRKCLDLSK
jgi:hypothetical protein